MREREKERIQRVKDAQKRLEEIKTRIRIREETVTDFVGDKLTTRFPLYSREVQALETRKSRSYLQLALRPSQPCLRTRCLPRDGTARHLGFNIGVPLIKGCPTSRCLAVFSIELKTYRHTNSSRWSSLKPCKTQTTSLLNWAASTSNQTKQIQADCCSLELFRVRAGKTLSS